MNKREEVLEGFSQVFNKRAWLDKVKMETALAGYTASEVHCMEFIGKHTDPNVTKMAEAMYMTRGAISKANQENGKKRVYRKLSKSREQKRSLF